MCGLTYLYAENYDEQQLRHTTGKALELMRHRGPDGQGIWIDQQVAIGHVRLSIIDIQGSNQPMPDPSGRYTLAYNGEIYNYQDLRQRLESRWSFKTHGDTEVLLAGLILHGSEFLNDLDGMWAFVLWDKSNRTLLAGRDRMGKKPLYFKSSRSLFTCASELPVLASLCQEHWQEDVDSTADYLRYGLYLPGTTAYKDVHEVRPGQILEWQPGKEPNQQPYWELRLGTFNGSRNKADALLRQALIGSVKRRMVADVEVGTFLSGGVDSSLVSSIMAKEFNITPKAFTIGFKEKAYDESEYAKLMAAHIGAQHYVEYLENWDRDLLVDIILKKIGQPFSDSSILPTYMVSKLAANHVKVALSGDGGDELFSGYQRYQARSILRWYTRLPRSLRSGAKRLVQKLPEPMAHHSRSVLKKMHLFMDVADRIESETPYVSPVMYSNERFAQIAPDLHNRGHAIDYLPVTDSTDSLLNMMHSDALVYLPQDILVKVDRASMANSLETRAPFLSKEVVELAFSLPRHWHRSYFSGKKTLKSSCGDFLPSSIWGRRKQGFGVPIHQWFREDLGKEMMELLHETPNLPLNKLEIQTLFKQHQQRLRDHGYRLWNLYIYLLWKQRNRI